MMSFDIWCFKFGSLRPSEFVLILVMDRNFMLNMSLKSRELSSWMSVSLIYELPVSDLDTRC